MERYMEILISTSILMSAIILGLILFNKLFSSKYPAKWRYYIWLIVLVGLIIPYRPDITLPFAPVHIPVIDSINQSNVNNIDFYSSDSQDYASLGLTADSEQTDSLDDTSGIAERTSGFPITTAVFVIWLAGALFVLAANIVQHKKFLSMVKRWGTDIDDEQILVTLQKEQIGLGLSQKNIAFKKCKSITSPMLVGFIKPAILLPDRQIHSDELPLILKHELIHYKRKDLWVNLLVVMTTAIHWFNPIVHIMADMICNDCEVSCDEAVLGGTELESRRTYGEAIIGVIGRKKTLKTALSTNFYGGKNTMKKRIVSIMNIQKKKRWLAVLCGILVLTSTLLSGSVLAGTSEITAEKAQEIALSETGGGEVVKWELDYEDGIKVYEIEITSSSNKYSMDIGTTDGKIYNYKEKAVKTEKTDSNASSSTKISQPTLITAEKAKEIALEKAGGGTVREWELDYEKGVWVYEVEVISNNVEYDIDINAETGEIIEFEIDD